METTRVKDIEFRSAEHVLQEIENMNVRGGSPFGRSAAWVPFLPLGSGQINCKSWGNLTSIPLSLKHGPHSPPHTGSTCCIFLS